jgi:hypothetical protein
MGSWGSGPFENDGAQDFVRDAGASPVASVEAALLRIVTAAADEYLDVDDGQAAFAASELVALGLGYAKSDGLDPRVIRIATELRPSESLLRLALAALPRIGAHDTSELAGLWSEGGGTEFDDAIADLTARLVAAGT